MYFKFKLSPGQQAPPGSTGIGFGDGWIVFVADKWPSGHDAVMHEAMTAEEITAHINAVYKAKADAEIEGLADTGEQVRMLARAVELLEKKVDGTLTAEDQTEIAALKAARKALADVRAKHEADGAAEIAADTGAE
jgi:hypothetical protein